MRLRRPIVVRPSISTCDAITVARVDPHVRSDDAVGADLDVVGELGRGIDQRGRMETHQRAGHAVRPGGTTILYAHIRSASAQSAPSTLALPEYFHIPRSDRLSSTSRIIWSPGITGFLKRALSMPTK